jgi:hypothetical protein
MTGVGLVHAGEYESLLEKGEFFLEKGNAYAPDAVRPLEAAAEKNLERAQKDLRYVVALAKAYTRVNRLSEAYYWVVSYDELVKPSPETEAIKDFLLNEAGVGRLRLSAAIATEGVTASFESTGATKIDVTGRKILDKLNRWIGRPFDLEAEGLTLLVPEGEYKLSANMPLTRADTTSTVVEVWAGDELEQHIVAPYPPSELIDATAGNRTVALSWPETERASYRVVRSAEGEEPLVVYEGKEPWFTDTGLFAGVVIDYTVETLGPDLSLWAVGTVQAMALPPVTEVWGEVTLDADLHATLWWATGEGALDRLVVLKEMDNEVVTLVDVSGDEVVRNAEIRDGPMIPGKSPFEIEYRVQVWVDGEAEPVEFSATLAVASEVVEIDSVSEEMRPDNVYVEWTTVPDDALAEGYAIYLIRSRLGYGKLVGRVENAMARDFSYVPQGKVEPNAQWKHIVMPYIGERLLVWPEPFELSIEEPKEPQLEKRFDRAERRGRKLPNVMLSWDRHPDAKSYLVKRSGIEDPEDVDEWVVKKPTFDYLELSGLQTVLMGTRHRIEVSAVLYSGERVPIISMDVNFEHYPRTKVQ